jgi:putative transposase
MATYFITICAYTHCNLFQRSEVAQLMAATLFNYRDAGEFELHEYVIMPDHIHVLLSLHDEQKLSRAIQLIKGGFSHTLGENGIMFREVWQQRYHDRRIRDDNEFAEIAEYIRQNPVRCGLVERAEEYPYSSAKVPGLKPLLNKKETVNASLKARSTDPAGAAITSGEVRSRDFSGSAHASLKTDCADVARTQDMGLKAHDEIFVTR